jgi:putative peptidoglycan lipid II flippase
MSKKISLRLFFSISCTFLSRIAGFLRALADAYQAAFRLANFFREVFGEGALGSVFTPLYAKIDAEQGQKQARSFFAAILAIVIFTALLLVITLLLFLKPILKLYVGNFSPEKMALTAELAAIMLPYLLFIAVASLFMIMHQIKGRFIFSSTHPIIFSICVIGAGLLNPLQDITRSLAAGILCGGIGQLLILALSLKKWWPEKFSLKDNLADIKKFFTLLLPVLFSLTISRINKLIDLRFASGLISGSLSSLTYAIVIINVPLGLIGVASTNVFYPVIAGLKAGNSHEEFQKASSGALDFLFTLAIPAAFFLWLFAHSSASLLFLRIPAFLGIDSKFSPEAARLLGDSLSGYSPGMVSLILAPMVIRLFHAALDTKTPAIIGIFILLLNIGLNIILTPLYAHTGIAWATSISALVQLFLLFIILHKKQVFRFPAKLLQNIIISCLCCFPVALLCNTIPENLISPLPELAVFVLCLSPLFYLKIRSHKNQL